MRTLAMLAGAVAFFTAVIAVRDHAALVRTGYDLTALEQARERLVLSSAEYREQVGRLSSPASLAQRAGALGLSTDYTRDFILVRVGLPVFMAPTVAENGQHGGRR